MDTPANSVESTPTVSPAIGEVVDAAGVSRKLTAAKPVSLARRIAGRTTDLLAVAIVLVASLSLGRQLLYWWEADPPPAMNLGPLDAAGAGWGDQAHPVVLEFGNSPLTLIRRSSFQGSLDDVLNEIRQQCQDALVQSRVPDMPADHEELEQLQELEKLTPDTEQPANWRLYTLGSGLVTVVGIKNFPATAQKSARGGPSNTWRVICWGLAFPEISNAGWTSWTFVRKSTAGSGTAQPSQNGFDLSRIELPSGSQRTLLMQEAGSGGLLGFQGRDGKEVWRKHFERWFHKHGWTANGMWREDDSGWSGQFVRREAKHVSDSTIQVQFHSQNADHGVGLIHWLPGRPAETGASPSSSRGTP